MGMVGDRGVLIVLCYVEQCHQGLDLRTWYHHPCSSHNVSASWSSAGVVSWILLMHAVWFRTLSKMAYRPKRRYLYGLKFLSFPFFMILHVNLLYFVEFRIISADRPALYLCITFEVVLIRAF